MTSPNPPTTGEEQLVIYLTKNNGEIVNDVTVSVSVVAFGMKIGTQDGMAAKQGNGKFVYPVKFHMQTKYDVLLWIYRGERVIAIQNTTISLN